jgi:hypothetical protein
MKLFMPTLSLLLYYVFELVSALPAKRGDHPACSVGEAKSALIQMGSCACVTFLVFSSSHPSPMLFSGCPMLFFTFTNLLPGPLSKCLTYRVKIV